MDIPSKSMITVTVGEGEKRGQEWTGRPCEKKRRDNKLTCWDGFSGVGSTDTQSKVLFNCTDAEAFFTFVCCLLVSRRGRRRCFRAGGGGRGCSHRSRRGSPSLPWLAAKARHSSPAPTRGSAAVRVAWCTPAAWRYRSCRTSVRRCRDP